MGLRLCSRCVTPETHETIFFDKEGVCNVCRQQEFKQEKIDWDLRKKELHELLDAHRGKGDYDCIVPFSGGKDSTYTLYALVKEYGMKPLVVSFDHGFYRPTVQEGKLRPHISARYPLAQGAQAITDMMNRKVMGKVVITA